jgi:DNA (cytosine-5)-methyltransferase 1
MAANHWDLAVRTHNTNHPDADHDCADISQVDPRRYPPTDLLWASPECTNHSQARGKRRADQIPDLFGEVLPDAAAERSRATMWDVPRFIEAAKLRGRPYRGFVVENVVEVRDWLYFDAWRMALEAADYCLHLVCLNSAYAQAGGDPAAQSRDRGYIAGHLVGLPCPDLDRWTRPAAWCPRCEEVVRAMQAWKRPDRPAWGRYRKQYVYRCPKVACRNEIVEPGFLPAASVIDWSLLGERIGDRTKPLAVKTMDRIRAGLRRHGRHLLLPVEGRTGVVARPADQPMRTQTGRLETGLVIEMRNNGTGRSAGRPLSTVCAAGNHHGLLVPAGGTWNESALPTTQPFRTRTTRETEAILMHPAMVLRNYNSRGGQMCTPVDEPIRTVVASSVQSLVSMPWMVVDYNGPARSIVEPLPTQTTVEGDGLCSIDEIVDDCLFRMLTPTEIQGAMAFDPAYRVLGNKREQVRQLGNAVTPPAARDLIAALAEAITGQAFDTYEVAA